MKNGLVTVVLPIYNVEPYLERCIKSVVNQTYQNLEILLIDDGSPDSCPKICDEWAEKDSRIRVIHKQNAGSGMARNTGIENASGEYICFFDSDDYIAPNTVESAYSLAKNQTADVVIFGFNTVGSNGNIVKCFKPCDKPNVFTDADVLEKFMPDLIAPSPYVKEPKRFYMSMWVLMCSMRTIKEANWRFVSEREIFSEDVYSLLSLFKYVNKVAVLPEALYYYCENPVSLSRGYKPGRYERLKHFYIECLKLCEKLGYGDEIKHRVSKPFVSFTIAALKQECAVNASFKECVNAVKRIASDETLRNVLKHNKKDIATTSRRIIFFLLRNRMYLLATILFKLKK